MRNNEFDEGMRLMNYTTPQWGQIILISLINAIGLSCHSLVFQFENSAFINLVGYIQIIFAFITDLIIFEYEFGFLELIGASIIAAINILAIIKKYSE